MLKQLHKENENPFYVSQTPFSCMFPDFYVSAPRE